MFAIEFSSRAKKEYDALEDSIKKRIEEALNTLKIDPIPARLFDVKKLRGLEDTFRIRIGKIRMVYIIVWERSFQGYLSGNLHMNRKLKRDCFSLLVFF